MSLNKTRSNVLVESTRMKSGIELTTLVIIQSLILLAVCLVLRVRNIETDKLKTEIKQLEEGTSRGSRRIRSLEEVSTEGDFNMTEKLPFPEPGIYLDMPESKYHSIPALSKSLVKKFMISPIDAWEALNKEQEHKDCFDYGNALHAFLLEGKEVFDKQFCKGFDPRDFPDALATVEQIKSRLKAHGIKPEGNKPDLIKLLLDQDPDAPIIDKLKEDHNSAAKSKIQLSAKDYDEIVSREWLIGKAGIEKEALKEVSFFWYDDQLKCNCKARLDSVLVDGSTARIDDIKSFVNSRERNIEGFAGYEIGMRKYHIDAYFYATALQSTPHLFRGSPHECNWPVIIDPTFHLLFIEKGRENPNVMPCEIILQSMGNKTELCLAAEVSIRNAAGQFNKLFKELGELPWNRIHNSSEITEEHIPPYFL